VRLTQASFEDLLNVYFKYEGYYTKKAINKFGTQLMSECEIQLQETQYKLWYMRYLHIKNFNIWSYYQKLSIAGKESKIRFNEMQEKLLKALNIAMKKLDYLTASIRYEKRYLEEVKKREV